MKLIVGLGNPGDKYTATRHNVGFWFIERLAAQSGTVLRKDGKFQALVGRHEASGAWLVQPQTFMNSSGRAVQTMASFFRIQPADILVIHDELDLPPGAARLKQGGGIAGHNGLKDISARLGSHDYWRLRLGIGRPAGRGATIDYVLHKPAQDERAAIDEAMTRAFEVLPLLLAGDTQGAMHKLHTQAPEQKPERPAPAPPPTARPDPSPAPALELLAARPAPAGESGEPARKLSAIERFGDSALGRQLGPAGSAVNAGATSETGNTAPSGKTAESAPSGKTAESAQCGKAEEPAQTEKKGRLNSLLKKFLPGGDPARKK